MRARHRTHRPELGGIAELCREGLEVTGQVGGWNARDPQRTMTRGGTTPTSVVMGGQCLPLRRLRVQQVDGSAEVPLVSYGVFAQGDLLNRVVMERMLAGIATRSFERVADPIGPTARATATSTSKSAVSRRFVTGTKKALDGLLARDLSGLDPAVLMVDGADFAGAMCVVALVSALVGSSPWSSSSVDCATIAAAIERSRGLLDRFDMSLTLREPGRAA